jgi:hypothetical protein
MLILAVAAGKTSFKTLPFSAKALFWFAPAVLTSMYALTPDFAQNTLVS